MSHVAGRYLLAYGSGVLLISTGSARQDFKIFKYVSLSCLTIEGYFIELLDRTVICDNLKQQNKSTIKQFHKITFNSQKIKRNILKNLEVLPCRPCRYQQNTTAHHI